LEEPGDVKSPQVNREWDRSWSKWWGARMENCHWHFLSVCWITYRLSVF
jgi:hypothetical protein